MSGDVLGGDGTAIVRLVRVLEKYLDAKDAVWTQVVGDVVDLDVFWQGEFLAQFTPCHLVAVDAELRLVMSGHFQQLTVHVHLPTPMT